MTHSFRLAVSNSEIDLERTLRSGQTFRWRKDEHGVWQGSDGDTWWSFRQTRDEISVVSNHCEDVAQRYLGLDVRFADLVKHVAERGPELSSFLDSLSGLKILRASDALETTLSFLCSGNNSLHRIVPMANWLGSCGKGLPNGAWRFPDLDRLATVTESELRTAGFGYRAAFIVRSIRMIEDRGGVAWLNGLRERAYQEAWTELTTLPGIGRKIADCICLFGLGHREAVPIDTHIWQQLTRLYHPELVGENLTANRYEYASEAFRARFGEYAGWAHQFLFEDNVAHGRARRKAASVLSPGA